MRVSFRANVHRLRKSGGQAAQVFRRICAVLCDEFDQRRADHHAVGHAGDFLGLFGRAHAEADRDRQVGRALDAGRQSASIDSIAACCLPVIPATET